MSHFVILVVGDDYESQLAPFEEQSNNPEENDFFIFKNLSNSIEEKQEYETREVDLISYLGKFYSEYDDKFYKDIEGSSQKELSLPLEAFLVKGKIKELYPTYEEYLSEYSGYRYYNNQQAYGYWYNPNAKWDWYQVGGRWTGYFKLKEGAFGIYGTPGLMTEKAEIGYADSVMIGDIDFEGMIQDTQKKGNETYNKIESLLKGREYPNWKNILKKYGEENIKEAKEEYYSNEVVQEFNDAKFYIWGDFQEEYGSSRKEYLEKITKNVMVPFAILKDGQWYEKGKMGWWAMVSNEMGQENWNEKFQELITGLPKDTLITAVDCHI